MVTGRIDGRTFWLDSIAVSAIVGIHFFLLGKYGIYDWKINDGVGYYNLAQNLREWRFWVSVPDLHEALSVTLLRLPLYSLLIMAAQDIFGRFWTEAIVAAQMAAVIVANLLLYRVLVMFSGLWIIGTAAAVLFALTPINLFARYILTDSLVLALFTIVTCRLAVMVYKTSYLTKFQMWSLGVTFAVLFLLREADLVFALALSPLVVSCIAARRVRAVARVYAPMIVMFLVIGFWNTYRVGTFIITTGATFNPIISLSAADKISPVLDDRDVIDRTIKETYKGAVGNEMAELLEISRILKDELNVDAAKLSSIMTKRYLSAWLHHPVTMAMRLLNNWQDDARNAFVLSKISNDPNLTEFTKRSYQWLSQQIMIWALIICPLGCIIVGAVVPRLRREVFLVCSLWLFSASLVVFYCAMHFEQRYLFPMYGSALMILALSCGMAFRTAQFRIRSQHSGDNAGLQHAA